MSVVSKAIGTLTGADKAAKSARQAAQQQAAATMQAAELNRKATQEAARGAQLQLEQAEARRKAQDEAASDQFEFATDTPQVALGEDDDDELRRNRGGRAAYSTARTPGRVGGGLNL